MSRRHYSSNAIPNTITNSMDASIAQFTAATALAGFPAQYPYTVALDLDTPSEELVTVTAAPAGLVYPITRGIDGTSAVLHTAGATITHVMSAQDLDEPNAHVNATAGVHGLAPGDSVVGASSLAGRALDAAVVHNSGNENIAGVKTFTSAPVLPAGSIPSTALAGSATLVDLTTAQSLSNKTLVSPTITSPIVNNLTLTGTNSIGGVTTITGTTSISAPTIADLTNIQHDHSGTTNGGKIPEASVTNLPADLLVRAPLVAVGGAYAGTSPAVSSATWISQSGSTTLNTGGGGTTLLTFPQAFPNGILSVVAVSGDASACQFVIPSTPGGSLTQVALNCYKISGGSVNPVGVQGVRINWFAIGW